MQPDTGVGIGFREERGDLQVPGRKGGDVGAGAAGGGVGRQADVGWHSRSPPVEGFHVPVKDGDQVSYAHCQASVCLSGTLVDCSSV